MRDGLFWEVAALSTRLQVSQLCLLVAVEMPDAAETWRVRLDSFGFATSIIDGNSISSIIDADNALKQQDRPAAILCHSDTKFGGVQLERWSDLQGSDGACFRKNATLLGKVGSGACSIEERGYATAKEDATQPLLVLVASNSYKAIELAGRLKPP